MSQRRVLRPRSAAFVRIPAARVLVAALASWVATTATLAQTAPPAPPAVPSAAPAAPAAAATRQSSVTEFDARGARDAASAGARPVRQALAHPLAHPPLQKIDLFHGEARLIPVRGAIKRIAIGNGAMLSVTSVDDGILILGEQPGTSSLMVWSDGQLAEYLVTVTEQDNARSLAYVQSLMRDFPTVSTERIGDRIILRGSVYKPALDQIVAVVGNLPNVVNLLREDEGFPKKKTVRFKVQIVELNRTIAEDLGIAWDKSFAGPRLDFQASGRHTGLYNQLPAPENGDQLFTKGRFPAQIGNALGGTYFGIATNILSSINLAVNNGDATVLASPEVSTASGGEAKFLAGGEVPIVTTSFGGTSVDYKQYGIILNIKPLVDRDDNISAAVETEVSQIDPSITYGGFPAFLTRKSRSDVSLRPLETLVISGMVNSNWSRSADKVPGLGDVPVLGRLFRSDSFRNQRSDLVIFVTPDVTASQDARQPLVDKARAIGDRVPAVMRDPLFEAPPAATDTGPSITPLAPNTVPVPDVVPSGRVVRPVPSSEVSP